MFVVAATSSVVSISLLRTITVTIFSSRSTSTFLTPSTFFSELRTATTQPTQVMFSTSSTMTSSPCCNTSAVSAFATLPNNNNNARSVASVVFRVNAFSTRMHSYLFTYSAFITQLVRPLQRSKGNQLHRSLSQPPLL